MNAEWLWMAGIAGGIAAFMLAVELLARLSPAGSSSGREEDDEDEGSSFTVDE